MDLDTWNKRSTFSSLCDKDPWYFFLPSSFRLKCSLNVTLERKGRGDVSCAYQWETSEVDWWLATNLDKIQLNEVAFRLKLLTRQRNRNPFFRHGRETQDFKYHFWIRPGFERKHDDDDYSDDENVSSKLPSVSFLQMKFDSHTIIKFIGLIVFILGILVYFSPRS